MKLLHAADFHLDSPFRSLSAEEARLRRAEQRQALTALRDAALTHGVDLALLPGDLFDDHQTHPETLTELARTLGEMNCPVFIAPGNHDPLTDRSPYRSIQWPGNVHIFSSETVECVHIPSLNARVYGCAFLSAGQDSDPLAGFTAARDGSLCLGCFHAQVGPADNPYAPISPASLAQSGLRYAALGHVHAFSGVQTAGETAWAYSGCLQGRGFDEAGDKGCLVVEITDDALRADFIPLSGSRYVLVKADVTARDPLAALRQALAGHEKDLCRVTLTGESDALDLSDLSRNARGLCRSLQLLDETLPPLDLWAGAGEENLRGLFLRQMRQRLDRADETERETLLLALRFGLAALENREFPATEVGSC